MERCDSLSTFTAGFLVVRSPLPLRLRLSSSLPSDPTPAGGPGALWCGRSFAACRWSVRASQVPGELSCAYALLSDPGGTRATRLYGGLTRPPKWQRRRLPAGEAISGLNHTALALAVYASTRPLRGALQDSLPAAGQALPGGIGYPQSSNERFL